MDASEITREQQLERAAQRLGLRLLKSPQLDPHAKDYGKYKIENPQVEGGSPDEYSLDLDGVEATLFSQHTRHGPPLRRDEDYENAITPHAPHDGCWTHDDG